MKEYTITQLKVILHELYDSLDFENNALKLSTCEDERTDFANNIKQIKREISEVQEEISERVEIQFNQVQCQDNSGDSK